jgi:very-short-patch-repair endonuclease
MSRATSLRRTATGAETVLWRALRGAKLNGSKFRRQHPIDRFVVDFVCLKAKLVIEVDGATHGSSAALGRDAGRTQVLEAAGFHVMRVGNTDIRDNLDGVLESILTAILLRNYL